MHYVQLRLTKVEMTEIGTLKNVFGYQKRTEESDTTTLAEGISRSCRGVEITGKTRLTDEEPNNRCEDFYTISLQFLQFPPVGSDSPSSWGTGHYLLPLCVLDWLSA